jgi:uncharacterized protein (TIGR03083 family)
MSEAFARDCTAQIRSEVAALLATVRAGGAALWDAPTYCQGWAVKDAVAHVVTAIGVHDGNTRAALAGRPPELLGAERAAERNQALAAQPREEVLAALDAAARRYAELLDGLDAAALETPVPLPFGTFSVAAIAMIVLDEVVIHHWDIRQPRDPDARLTPAAVPLLAVGLLPAIGLLCRGPKTDGIWQLDVDTPTVGPLTLRVQGDQATVERGAAAAPDVHVAIAGEAFPLLLWGRLDVAAALAGGRLRLLAGERARALALQQMFPGG